jgi:uncharacterized membrane protein
MKKIRLARLSWVGPLTVATSVLTVLAVQFIATRALSPLPRFSQAVLSSTEPASVTTALVSAAVLVFALSVRWATNPLRRYRQIALGALLVSFVPNVAAGFFMRPAVDWPSMMALMSMHIVAWAVTVSMLTRLTTVEVDGCDLAEPRESNYDGN